MVTLHSIWQHWATLKHVYGNTTQHKKIRNKPEIKPVNIHVKSSYNIHRCKSFLRKCGTQRLRAIYCEHYTFFFIFFFYPKIAAVSIEVGHLSVSNALFQNFVDVEANWSRWQKLKGLFHDSKNIRRNIR